MTAYFTIEPVDAQACADHEDRHESLYAAFKAAGHTTKIGDPPCELVAHGDVSALWEVEVEPGIAPWQGYQFEPCDGYYEHIANAHGNQYSLPDISHAETGVVRGANGHIIGTYAACRACNVLKIQPITKAWKGAIDFVTDARI